MICIVDSVMDNYIGNDIYIYYDKCVFYIIVYHPMLCKFEIILNYFIRVMKRIKLYCVILFYLMRLAISI